MGRGTPLWVPGPNRRSTLEYKRHGITIGDVGIISELGVFSFLFNVLLQADDPINRGVVPEGFHPLGLSADDIEEGNLRLQNTYYASDSIEVSQSNSDPS